MNAVVALFLSVLILAGGVLMWEARTGRFQADRRGWDALRGGLFFLAAVIGGAFLIRSVGGTVLLALAFVPVTLLSLMRFVSLARERWAGFASTLALTLALVAGLALSLQALPEPIDEGFFLEQILQSGGEGAPDSIDPGARRSVRV